MVVWIGSEPAWLGSGWRMFTSLDHYRSYMLVALYGWTAREASLSVLGLATSHALPESEAAARRAAREPAPGGARDRSVPIVTDGDNVRRRTTPPT